MIEKRIKHDQEMVGYDHPTKSDTLNIITTAEHGDDGTHLPSYASLYEYTPDGSTTNITTAGTYVKWAHSVAGLVTGAPFITSSTVDDEFTVDTSGTGVYDIFFSASVEGQAGMMVFLGVFIDGVREDRLTREVRLGGAHEHFPDSVDVKMGTINSGDVDSLKSKDATYLDIQEVATPTGFILDMSYEGVGSPLIVEAAGKYTGTTGHEVEMQLYDADTGADEVQDGGNGYTAIRSHTSGASTQPGTGADWESYWELKGAAAGEDAWVTATPYDDAFDDINATTKDFPHSTVDYVRRWIVPGSHVTRKKYSDNATGICRIRFIHTSAGTGAHQLLLDSISVLDDHSAASITLKDFLPLVSVEDVDARLTTDIDASEIITKNVNFNLNRIKIS